MTDEILAIEIETMNTKDRFSVIHLSKQLKEKLKELIGAIKREMLE